MLYRIIDPDWFPQCLDHVKRAYWPEEDYLKHRQALAFASVPARGEERIRETGRMLERIVGAVSGEKLYQALGNGGPADQAFSLPFLDRFHRLFLQRQWNEPYPDPQAQAEELFRLGPPENGGGNSSRNVGNYHHFVNVVAALARLVHYFQDAGHLYKILEDRAPEYGGLVYEKQPTLRTFKLMLAALYHDIGKSVVDPRHAVEGAIILAHHTTQGRYAIDRIVKAYHPDNEFDRDDFLFVADLVLYHDHYGTVGTGEDSYLPLVDVIDRIKRYSLKHDVDKTNLFGWSLRYLFDLWLLNVADIMVSLNWKPESPARKNWKFAPQEEWLDPQRAQDSITAFFDAPKGGGLVHDFKITADLLKRHCLKKHCDDLGPLETAAHDYSQRHVIERLRRLVTSSLIAPLADRVRDDNVTELIRISRCIQHLSEEQWNAAIARSIQAIASYSEFTQRFARIGKMDYALGFFQQIGEAALQRIEQELQGQAPTGWIRPVESGIRADFMEQAQAQFFADNFAATVVQILGYLIFREPANDRVRNIEFSDAKNRLTDEKMPQLLSLEGPARTRRSIQFILQTIYLY